MLNNSQQKQKGSNLKSPHIQNLQGGIVRFLVCLWTHSDNNKHGDAALLCWKERKGRGLPACVILWRCGWVQWKIVPIANPWQANYSFDPLSVCITVGRWEGGNTLLGSIPLWQNLFWLKDVSIYSQTVQRWNQCAVKSYIHYINTKVIRVLKPSANSFRSIQSFIEQIHQLHNMIQSHRQGYHLLHWAAHETQLLETWDTD